ncbi:hypothetical protein FA95DRAFT_853651 [Auriscalpium vulgare]|uniref:Uncharacterized protein n=1 Tax=Auriscalpium vulgare TaxID=40419 RepID=A0ACB8R9G9_9AGAM|nr:hypothetical protein FA95DRAFT_853651 [Auriscalpium vulgare]
MPLHHCVPRPVVLWHSLTALRYHTRQIGRQMPRSRARSFAMHTAQQLASTGSGGLKGPHIPDVPAGRSWQLASRDRSQGRPRVTAVEFLVRFHVGRVSSESEVGTSEAWHSGCAAASFPRLNTLYPRLAAGRNAVKVFERSTVNVQTAAKPSRKRVLRLQ